MPFKSKAQQRWGNSSAGQKALGKAGVKEWNKATTGKRLPERKTSKKNSSDTLRKLMQKKSK